MDFIREPRVGERRQQVYVTSSLICSINQSCRFLLLCRIMPINGRVQAGRICWPACWAIKCDWLDL